MQITSVTIRLSNEPSVRAYSVRAYVDIVFDNCFMVADIKIIHGPTGFFLSFPAREQRDGTFRDIAFPINAETRQMIEQAVLAEYEKVVAGSH